MALEVKMRHRRGPERPGKGLIVLIHGLNSSSGTWTEEGRNWVQLMLEDPELSEADVALVEYRTGMTSSKTARLFGRLNPFRRQMPLRSGSPTPVDLLARELKDELDLRAASYQMIVLVGHSMGGLVAIHYLLEEVQRNRPHKVRGYVSLATPFDGSHFATLKLAAPKMFEHEQLEALAPMSEFLDNTRRRWIELQERLGDVQFKHFFGEDDGIVNERSATPAVVADKWSGAVSLPGGHSEILEVAGHESKAYRHVKEHIVKVLYAPEGDPPPKHLVRKDDGGSSPQAPEGARLQAIATLAPLVRARRSLEQFVARFPDEVQEAVRQAAAEVQRMLAAMREEELGKFLQRYRYPFDADHADEAGIGELWQVLTLFHLACPTWRLYGEDEAANVELRRLELWKRLIHSVDRESMPQVLLALATRRMSGPYAPEVRAGRSELFPHRVILGNCVRLPAQSLCRHCRPQDRGPFPYRNLLRDFTEGEDAEVFEGVEPLSNTYEDLERVEVVCTDCLQNLVLGARRPQDLAQTIREVI